MNIPKGHCFELQLRVSFISMQQKGRILFSVVSDFFFFGGGGGGMLVDTITLENLNHSKANFHTRLLAGIARPSSKMGITGHM